jgi:hypothetical protein
VAERKNRRLGPLTRVLIELCARSLPSDLHGQSRGAAAALRRIGEIHEDVDGDDLSERELLGHYAYVMALEHHRGELRGKGSRVPDTDDAISVLILATKAFCSGAVLEGVLENVSDGIADARAERHAEVAHA